MDANALGLTVTGYTILDPAGKTAIGTLMLAASPFADKAAVQGALGNAIVLNGIISNANLAKIAYITAGGLDADAPYTAVETALGALQVAIPTKLELDITTTAAALVTETELLVAATAALT